VINIKGKTILQNAYYRQEFISSSDMNFRPVNSATGPDGTLYIVDMHRGIIQQANWTKPGSFLREKIDSLGLAKNTGHGRIYRLVHDGFKPGPKPNMLNESPLKLVSYLTHANGWWRDNAQKQLIALGDKSVVPALKAMAVETTSSMNPDSNHLARLHALWTLEGLGAIDKEILYTAFNDKHPQVRRAAVWISERFVKKNDEQVIQKLAGLKNDSSYDVRIQLLLSFYHSKSEKAKSIIKEILNGNTENDMLAITKTALDRNENVRTFGSRLGNMVAADRNLILSGSSTFKSFCSSCHGPDGKGLAIAGAMAAPSLVGSKRLALPEKNTALRILLHGLTGPVDGKTYSSLMPSMAANSDEWIAQVASYVRYEFGGNTRGVSPVVTMQEVKKMREETAGRENAWTIPELENKAKEDKTLQVATGQTLTPLRP
jgi:mono/diheme cytochrome c family protein